jgi:xanthine dehydrogenase YagR molybdenum-binding subunit
MSQRLVRTTAEMEGRVEEVWTLVDEEDELEHWPRNGEELSLVGRPATRQDGPLRASGRARYTVDVRLPGMLHAAVLRSPVAHARVTAIDLEAARRAPGVRAVIGPECEVAFTPMLSSPQPIVTLEPVYAGQPIALLAADSREQAEAALSAFALELETLPHTVDARDALRDLRLTAEPMEVSRGNVDAALAGADVTVELELATPDHLQTPLEPHAAVARWEGEELTVWLSTQGMFDARRELAEAFGLQPRQVRVIAEFIGGGFGAKQGGGFEATASAELARLTGHPVRLVNDRHAEQLDGGRRARTRQTVRLGASHDGTLSAIEVEAVMDQGRGGMEYLVPLILAPSLSLYACENVRAMGAMATTHRRGQNAFRAPGMTEGITAFEQAVDELAGALGIDPLELRRRNHTDVDPGSGAPYSGKRLLQCYTRAAELAGWDERERLREPQPDGLLRGMGCASQIWYGSGGPPAHASIRIDAAGSARVTTGIQDIGTGTLTAARLVAAQELGLPLDRVIVVGGDTAPNLYGPVAGGSMTVPSVMPAVRAAAAKARRLLLHLASDVLEISADDLELDDGRLRSPDAIIDVDVIEITERLGNASIDASGGRGPNGSGGVVQTFGCQIAQVAVDPEVGEVRVERIVAVHDVGRIINPLGASSQVEGGVLQGMAYALTEELVVDPTTGVPVNASLDDYKLPTIADTPEIVVDFVDVPDANVPNTGSRGLGEPPIIPTAAALANAVAHATGRRCRALPMTRARVIEALA